MRDYFQDGQEFGVQMTYAVEEDQPLGTAGCVKNVEELLDKTFLVILRPCKDFCQYFLIKVKRI